MIKNIQKPNMIRLLDLIRVVEQLQESLEQRLQDTGDVRTN